MTDDSKQTDHGQGTVDLLADLAEKYKNPLTALRRKSEVALEEINENVPLTFEGKRLIFLCNHLTALQECMSHPSGIPLNEEQISEVGKQVRMIRREINRLGRELDPKLLTQ